MPDPAAFHTRATHNHRRAKGLTLPPRRITLPQTPTKRCPGLRIAYLVNTYPRASHSFIRREIQALERRGVQIHRFAMRSDRAALVDPADLAEDTQTEHILKAPALRLLATALGWMRRHPAQSLAALRLALQCGARGAGAGSGRLKHLIYLTEAAYLAARCKALSLGHIHAHFGTNSATTAMLAEALGGPGFSFTTHGPEEFDAPLALSLPEKLHRARFAIAISSFGRSQLCRWSAPADWPRFHVVHCGIEPALHRCHPGGRTSSPSAALPNKKALPC